MDLQHCGHVPTSWCATYTTESIPWAAAFFAHASSAVRPPPGLDLKKDHESS